MSGAIFFSGKYGRNTQTYGRPFYWKTFKINRMEYFLGIIAMALGLIVTLLGFPMQIIKNWKSKSADDLSLSMWTLSFLSSLSWVLYGYFREYPDYFLVVPSLFGSLFAGIIIAQIIMYKESV